MNIRRSLAILALAFFLVGCGSATVATSTPSFTPTPKSPQLASGYLVTSKVSATYLRILQDASGKFSGVWYGTLVNADRTTSSYQGTISGTQAGAQVIIAFTGIGADTDTGTLSSDGKTLTLQYQGTNGQIVTALYHAASLQDYNTAVANL